MLKFGNKEFRNLQEQVEKNMKDILFILQEEDVLNGFGIKVVGQEDTAASMPTVADYKENNPDWAYGDAYAIGTKAPYTLYILTRANGTHPNDYWFNIGSFPVTGPQGPQGPKGEVGPQGQTGNPGTNGLDAGFGTISATAETVSSTDPATVTITTSGPNTAKNISFAFEIPQGEKGDTASAEWGHIDGSIDNQTDLVNALQAKQNASNAVTTDGTQTITGDKTFTNTNGIHIKGKVDFGAKVSGRTNTSYIATDNYDGIGLWVNGIRSVNVYDNATYFAKKIVPNSTSVDIGDSTHPWRDAYISGNLSDGTNSISVANIASKDNLNFLSLDGGTMKGNIMTGGFASPEEAVLGNGLDVSDLSSQSEPVTHYGGGYIRQDDDEDSSIKYTYHFPKKSGTLAISENLPKYSDITNFTCQNVNFVLDSASGYAELKNNLLVINAVIKGTSDSAGQIFFDFTLPEEVGSLIKPFVLNYVSVVLGRLFNANSGGANTTVYLIKNSDTSFTFRFNESYAIKTLYSVIISVLL